MIDYFTNIHQSKFILRRDHILEFIYSAPSKRYEAIGELIGIKSLNDIEATLLKVCDYFEREFCLKENAISTIVSFISQYLGVASLDQKNILDSLNRVLEKEGLENLKSFETMDEYIKDLMRFCKR